MSKRDATGSAFHYNQTERAYEELNFWARVSAIAVLRKDFDDAADCAEQFEKARAWHREAGQAYTDARRAEQA